MIEGEAGPAVLSQIAALQMDALIDGDSITTVLIGACIADALRKGETPRAVARGLLRGLPADHEWSLLRERIRDALDEFESREAA